MSDEAFTLESLLKLRDAAKQAAIKPVTNRVGARAWGKPFYRLIRPKPPLYARIKRASSRLPLHRSKRQPSPLT